MNLNETEEITLLSGSEDHFKGVTVDQKLLAKTSTLFERQLKLSLDAWHVLLNDEKFGFILHHAKPDYVMLTHWLDKNEPNQFPSYAMSTIGVGGLVVNKKLEVLLIQERYYDIDDYFKLPGSGESIEDGVKREVFEETGIRAHFRGILTFTYELNFRFEHSDIYFVCLMSLDENDEEPKIIFNPLEITAYKWISLDQWANSPEMHSEGVTLHFARIAMAILDEPEQLFKPDRIQIILKDLNKPPWEKLMYMKNICS